MNSRLFSVAAACLSSCLLLRPFTRAQEAVPMPSPPPDFDLMAALAEGHPLTSKDAQDRVVERAPAMERVEALTRASEAAVERVRAQLWPRLDFSARYAHIDGFPDGRIGPAMDPETLAQARMLAGQITDPNSRSLWLSSLERSAGAQVIRIPRDQVAFGARVTYPVSDLFLAVVPTLRATRAAARATRAETRAREARLRLNALESYYQLARARGTLAVTRRALEQARLQQARIDAGVRAGLRPPADASSATARVAAAEQAVVAAETAVDVTDAALRTLLEDADGPPYGIADRVLDLEVVGAPEPTEALLDRARAQRPEITALREQIESQRAAAKASTGAGYPHLSVFAGADYARPNRYVIPPNDEFQHSWEAGVLLTYSPNDSALAVRSGREHGARVDVLEADLRELEQALLLEVRNARAVLVRANRSAESARAAEAAAKDAYDRRLAELRAGDVTLADLYAAESDLNSARLQVLEAAVDRHVAQARLRYAVGD